MTERSRPRGPLHIAFVSAAALTFITGLAGCGAFSDASADKQETVQCANQNGEIVDDDLCDDTRGGGGGYSFIFLDGSTRYPPGHRVNPSMYSRPPVPYTDKTARQNAGLSPSGKVQTGQRSVGNAGIGKGSTGGDLGKSGGS